MTQHDPVNAPSHYTQFPGVEVIDLTQHLNFCRGNAVKYIARAGAKDPAKEVEDLEKAVFYIQKEIERLNAITAEKVESVEYDEWGVPAFEEYPMPEFLRPFYPHQVIATSGTWLFNGEPTTLIEGPEGDKSFFIVSTVVN